MSERRLWIRVRSRARGEVATTTLDAYRAASLSVLELAEEGLGAPGAFGLAVWLAFAHQTLGNCLLDADAEADPPAAGFVPPATARGVQRLYARVEGWLCLARELQANPAVPIEDALPAGLPRWSGKIPSPRPFVAGLLMASRMWLEVLGEPVASLGKETEDARALHGLYASALSKVRYAEDLHGRGTVAEVEPIVEAHLRRAVEGLFRLGQLLAMPELLRKAPTPPRFESEVEPGEKEFPAYPAPEASLRTFVQAPEPAPRAPKLREPFDPDAHLWRLTAPEAASLLRRDGEARMLLRAMWRDDPDPEATLTLQEALEDAVAKGHLRVARRNLNGRAPHSDRCPWGSVYVVVEGLHLDGRYRAGQERLTLDVGVRDGVFRRGLRVAEPRDLGR